MFIADNGSLSTKVPKWMSEKVARTCNKSPLGQDPKPPEVKTYNQESIQN